MGRIGVRRGGLAALLAALVSLVAAQGAGAVTHVTYNDPGAPIVSTAQTVFVAWGSLIDASLDTTDASMLSDIAASAGATDNVFSMLAQYSTTNIAGVLPSTGGTNQVLAQTQHYLGRFQITPSIGTGAATATITFAQMETELNAQIAAGHLPAPRGPGPQTTYVVLFPPKDVIDDGTGNKSGITFCGIHGDATAANGNKLLFIAMADNNNLWTSGCGPSSTAVNNETASLGHEMTEVLTDPLVGDNQIAWYAATGLTNEQGEIGDMCATGVSDEGTNTFNGHAYTVQKVWDQLAAACVVSDPTRYQPPSADFTATPSGAQASFAASASSPNADHGIASYDWSFGDGSTGSGASPSHAYAAGGSYTVSLTATDDLGFTAHATHQVTVSNPPPPPPPPPGPSGGGTPTPPAIHLAAQASSTALTSGSSLLVPLGSIVTCPAGATCTVTVTLTVPGTPTKGHGHPKPTVIGTATYRVGGGKLTPKVKLNARGIALLRKHHSLHATTSLKVSGAGTTLKRSGKLLIHSPVKKRKHR